MATLTKLLCDKNGQKLHTDRVGPCARERQGGWQGGECMNRWLIYPLAWFRLGFAFYALLSPFRLSSSSCRRPGRRGAGVGRSVIALISWLVRRVGCCAGRAGPGGLASSHWRFERTGQSKRGGLVGLGWSGVRTWISIHKC